MRIRRIGALLLAVVLCLAVGVWFLLRSAPFPVEGGTEVGISRNMWRMDRTCLGESGTRQLLAGADILLRFDRDGTLAVLRQEDLSVLAQTTVEAGELAFAQLLEEGICVTDPQRGTVTVFSPQLEITAEYTPQLPGQIWRMGLDGETIYAFSPEGVAALHLVDGSVETILEPGLQLELSGAAARTMTFVRVGGDLRERWYRLELEHGSLTELGEALDRAESAGLIPMDGGGYLYQDERYLVFYGSDGMAQTYGAFLPATDQQSPAEILEPVWSERWQGYFFVRRIGGSEELIFLEPSLTMPEGGISLQADAPAEGTLLPRELYDRAAAIGQRCGVELRIADQCQLDYNTFRSRVFGDPEKVSRALDVLEQALEKYPPGYLEQLKYDSVNRIRIELVSELTPDSDADVSSTAEAFSRKRTWEYLIVLDGDVLEETNLHHELAHVLGKRILFGSSLREDALYREEDWMALQPEGFAYADSYRDIAADVAEFYDSGYFARNYACVSASEDQATMMETAIMGRSDIYQRSPHLLPKLEYYTQCIRDSFDTTAWPEQTVWEQLLP